MFITGVPQTMGSSSTDLLKYFAQSLDSAHSMPEAAELGDRIGILVKGQLRCLGNATELQTRYAQGVVLTLTVDVAAKKKRVSGDPPSRTGGSTLEDSSPTSVSQPSITLETADLHVRTALEAEMMLSCGVVCDTVKLTDKQILSDTQCRLVYSVKSGSSETSRPRMGPITRFCATNPLEIIAEYTFADTNLEQVFLKFADEQQDESRDEEMIGLELAVDSA